MSGDAVNSWLQNHPMLDVLLALLLFYPQCNKLGISNKLVMRVHLSEELLVHSEWEV